MTPTNGATIDTTPRTGADLLATAFRLAVDAHAGQTDKAGQPYLAHPMRVAARVIGHGEHTIVAALLHDVVEDSGVTLDELQAAGIPAEVCTAINALTKREAEDYETAVRRAAADPLAVHVKAADIADNADPARLAMLDEALRDRLTAKYATGRRVLDEVSS